jgi:hypothetical protein
VNPPTRHWGTDPHAIQLPAPDRLPAAVHEQVHEFLALRGKVADAERALKAAGAAKVGAELADKTGLEAHVRAGGRAADYPATAPAAVKAMEAARAEHKIMRGVLTEATVALGPHLARHAEHGGQLAAAEIEATGAAYRRSIDACEQARRAYYAACHLGEFWRRVTVQHVAAYRESDVLHDARHRLVSGHIGSHLAGVDVDQATFAGLRQDAHAHVRLDVAARWEAGASLTQAERSSLGFGPVAGVEGRIS